VGHVLFNAARLRREPDPGRGASRPRPKAPDTGRIAILAPLAVVPDRQRQGIGGALIERDLQMLRRSGVDLVFVLGHPDYYPRHGFEPAGSLGFAAPFPIPPKDAGAWMVQAMRPGLTGSLRGTVLCADSMNRPEYWRE